MSTSNLHLKINELITGYNLAHSENLIDIEDFLKNLEKIGGVNSELMEYLEEKDLTDLAPNMPKLLVRAILIKLKTSVQDQQKNQPKGLRPEVMAWLENYDPTFPDTNAANLRVISRNQPCIVFTDDKKVDVATSAKLLEDIINGYPASNQYIIEGSNPRVVA